MISKCSKCGIGQNKKGVITSYKGYGKKHKQIFSICTCTAGEELKQQLHAEKVTKQLLGLPFKLDTPSIGSSYIQGGINKKNKVVFASHFGAVGDGVTDDSKALQAALDSGYKVILKNSTYYLGSPLTINGIGGTVVGANFITKLIRHIHV